MPKKTRDGDAQVEQLRARIDEWRRTRPHRTLMPAALWAEAVALAKSKGAYRVAKATGVNFDGLRRRVAEAASEAPPAFVELPVVPPADAAPDAGTVIELHASDGARLVLRLAKDAAIDVAQVVAAFRRRGGGGGGGGGGA
jgi:hypothetical protein